MTQLLMSSNYDKSCRSVRIKTSLQNRLQYLTVKQKHIDEPKLNIGDIGRISLSI